MNVIKQAAEKIQEADAILIGAGAGMGVDSGLPDFRGKEGFWNAYPAFRHLGYSFEEMANPEWFERDPYQAWGFYGHRLNAYRNCEPHEGFSIIKNWMTDKPSGGFVFTSNVDGHFQKSGFSEEEIYECHGSIHWLQSSEDTSGEIWSAEEELISVNEETCRAYDPIPLCPGSTVVARPNILMFGDWMWNSARSNQQGQKLQAFLDRVRGKRVVVVEIGAGKSVPTVRMNCERVAAVLNGSLIRINLSDSDGPYGTLSIAQKGLEALQAIDVLM